MNFLPYSTTKVQMGEVWSFEQLQLSADIVRGEEHQNHLPEVIWQVQFSSVQQTIKSSYLILLFGCASALKNLGPGFSSSSWSDSKSSPFHIRRFGLWSMSSSACIQRVHKEKRCNPRSNDNPTMSRKFFHCLLTSSGTSVVGGVVWKGTLGALGSRESCSSSMFLNKLQVTQLYKQHNYNKDVRTHNECMYKTLVKLFLSTTKFRCILKFYAWERDRERLFMQVCESSSKLN